MQKVINELHDRLSTSGSKEHPFAASLTILYHGRLVDRWTTGPIGRSEQHKVVSDTKFLVASLTKPVTVTAMMRLVEEGEVDLQTRVQSVIPGFIGGGKEDIRIWHLLTHTSGLPDMVPDNIALRERGAGLDEFFASLCRTPLCFRPGTQVGYQSMGFLVLAQLAQCLTGRPFRQFLADQVLQPIGMRDTCLGLPETDDGRSAALVNLPPGQAGTSWHWNSRYWRTLGAPWGGLLSTASDLAAFADLFVNGGQTRAGRQVISEATCVAMCRDWTGTLKPGFPPLGLGWFIRGEVQATSRPSGSLDEETGDRTGTVTAMDIVFNRDFFGSLPPSTVGHAGVTGCAMWADRHSGVAAALLTNTPAALRDGTLAHAADLLTAASRSSTN